MPPADAPSRTNTTPAQPGEPGLEIDRVRFGYQPDRTLLDGVSLRVAAGEVHVLSGASGCGKSTFMHLIAGLLRPHAGSIRIAGSPVADDQAFAQPERRRVGMMFQDFRLFPHLTALRNVTFAMRRVPRRDRARLAREHLDRLGVLACADALPQHLSGGQQQRVAAARALAADPRVMLLDEPFCNLDQETTDLVRPTILSALRDAGVATVLVTHDLRDARRFSDRCWCLCDRALRPLDGSHAADTDRPPCDDHDRLTDDTRRNGTDTASPHITLPVMNAPGSQPGSSRP